MSSRKEKGIRLTFSVQELRDYYAYLGGKVGEIQDCGAIHDQRPSEYADTVTAIRKTQDRIATAIREYEAEESSSVLPMHVVSSDPA
jgi:hypothetical protein